MLLLEQGQLSCGTTWHAAGLVGQLRATESGTRLVQYSAELYERLEAETGLAHRLPAVRRRHRRPHPGPHDPAAPDRRHRRGVRARAASCSARSRPTSCYPILRDDDLAGRDLAARRRHGQPDRPDRRAGQGRPRRGRHDRPSATRVTGIHDRRTAPVTGVRTDRGDVEAEIVVNCAGQWAKAVGALVRRDRAAALGRALLRRHRADRRASTATCRSCATRTATRTSRRRSAAWSSAASSRTPSRGSRPTRLPYPFEFQLLEEDWDHFSILMESALQRIPVLAETGIKKFYNGPESFTPDNQFILGEAPEVRNFFVGAGLQLGRHRVGGRRRAGARRVDRRGRARPATCPRVDIRRFASFNGNNQWLHDRVGEVLGLHYAIPWPNRELTSGPAVPPLARAPPARAAPGAASARKMGWERRQLLRAPRARSPDIEYSWGKQNWHALVDAEQRATRERGRALRPDVVRQVPASTGPDAERALQWLCTADVAVPPGRTVYTGMLNARGTYEADVTVTRLSADEFLLVTQRGVEHRARPGPHRQADRRRAVTRRSSTSPRVRRARRHGARGRATCWPGSPAPTSPMRRSRSAPAARSTSATPRCAPPGSPTSASSAGSCTCRPSSRSASTRTCSPARRRTSAWSNAGYYAIESLRLEKGVPRVRPRADPGLQPGRGRPAVRLQAEDRHRLPRPGGGRAGPGGRPAPPPGLVRASPTPRPMLWGGELVLRDGVAVGQVTSAAWGETLGALRRLWPTSAIRTARCSPPTWSGRGSTR